MAQAALEKAATAFILARQQCHTTCSLLSVSFTEMSGSFKIVNLFQGGMNRPMDILDTLQEASSYRFHKASGVVLVSRSCLSTV